MDQPSTRTMCGPNGHQNFLKLEVTRPEGQPLLRPCTTRPSLHRIDRLGLVQEWESALLCLIVLSGTDLWIWRR